MEPYIGEIRIFAGNFAPRDWAFCHGQLLPIAQNTALYSVIGVTYGGDGKTTFALPDLRGRAPMQQGEGPGLTPRRLGEVGGEANTTLRENELPSHHHVPNSKSGRGTVVDSQVPTGAVWGSGPSIYSNVAIENTMLPTAVGVTGNSLPHNNMQPYLGLNFIIALNGVYPPRP
nr:tail fiber protein [Lysinibacillus timonensis]